LRRSWAECGDLPLGALIFPTTLAIVVNVFTEPRERAAAIGIWTAIAGVGVALGPISGGWLREHFSWGSVFLVNVPVALVGIVGTDGLIPRSRDPRAPRLDLPGLALSIAGVTLLVWSLIEAPSHGMAVWGRDRVPVPAGAFAGGGSHLDRARARAAPAAAARTGRRTGRGVSAMRPTDTIDDRRSTIDD
jgi:MFS family permease